PSTARAWVSFPDAVAFVDQFNGTGLGQLFMSPPMHAAVENLRTQVENHIRQQNIRLGLGWEDVHNVRSGEICFAGIVLPADPGRPDQNARGSHGIVMLVDTAGNETAVEILLEKVVEELERLGASKEEMGPIQGTEVSKWRWPGIRGGPQRFTLIAVLDGWLLAGDNEAALREVILRIKGRSTDKLADLAAFQNVMQQVAVPDVVPQVRWFLEPFGYIALAQAIHDENQPFVVQRNNYVGKLQQNGFDVLNGIGGMIALNSSERDVLHRTFVSLVPAADRQGARGKVLRLFDFRNQWGHQLVPEPFAIKDAANYFTFTWRAGNLLENIDEVVDAFFEKGYYDKMINRMKEDGIDVLAAAQMLDNRFTWISKVREPIREDSECVAVTIWIKDKPQEFFRFLRRFIGDGKLVKDGEFEYWFIDRTIDDDDGPDIIDPRFDRGGVKDFDRLDQVDAKRPFNLFGKVHIAVYQNHVVIANNLEFMKELFSYNDSNLIVEGDYRRVVLALDQVGIDNDRVVTRGFGRMDRMVETNYQMFRQGKLPTTETIFAKILNQAIAGQNNSLDQRTQRFDGNLLPDDFQQFVAPFLGPSGWAMEQTTDGWLISGVWLKKTGEPSEVADQTAGAASTLNK
ncbi:MAG TPA: hypothetical protein PKD54_10930, partial [Pirellulaceae bacterium]|nr:hypothetical protein [Pirellulaceae bacterium]